MVDANYESEQGPEDHRKAARRHYHDRRRKQTLRDAGPLSLERIGDRDNLFACYQELKETGGKAPGPDRLMYQDLTGHEVGLILERISKSISEGTYRPHGVRRKPIPKPGSEEKRVLEIGGIFDRVVAKAVKEAVEPYWEQVFVDNSWGFRPGRGAWKMLADLEAMLVSEGRWIIAVDDVRRAFNNVWVEDVRDAHRQLIEQEDVVALEPTEQGRILGLIATVTQGTDPNRQIGISQGNPFSPLAMNAVLHYAHDVPLFDNLEHPPWYRYADNVCYLCRDVNEGQQVLERVRRALKTVHMDLKGEDGVHDLSAGHRANLLGFNLRKEGKRLEYEIHQDSWLRLGKHLEKAHEDPNPIWAAKEALRGWIDSTGPAFKTARDAIDRIQRLAAKYGFRETGSPRELRKIWRDAHGRWLETRTAAIRRKGRRG